MSDTSVFDAEAFMAQTTDQEGSTTYPKIPEDDYQSIIHKVEPKQVQGRDGTPFLILDVTHKILDEKAKQAAGRDEVFVRQGVFVDLLPNGALDMSEGKNVPLNRLRAAVGQNKPGVPWSPKNLEGAGPLVVHVGFSKADNPEDRFNEVKKTAPLASGTAAA